jgi:hypothetical protein
MAQPKMSAVMQAHVEQQLDRDWASELSERRPERSAPEPVKMRPPMANMPKGGRIYTDGKFTQMAPESWSAPPADLRVSDAEPPEPDEPAPLPYAGARITGQW